MAKNKWMEHLASTWKRLKPQGKSYREAMVGSKKTYRKGGDSDAASKKKVQKRRRKKK